MYVIADQRDLRRLKISQHGMVCKKEESRGKYNDLHEQELQLHKFGYPEYPMLMLYKRQYAEKNQYTRNNDNGLGHNAKI